MMAIEGKHLRDEEERDLRREPKPKMEVLCAEQMLRESSTRGDHVSSQQGDTGPCGRVREKLVERAIEQERPFDGVVGRGKKRITGQPQLEAAHLRQVVLRRD